MTGIYYSSKSILITSPLMEDLYHSEIDGLRVFEQTEATVDDDAVMYSARIVADVKG